MPRVTILIYGQPAILADLSRRSGVELNKTLLKATRAGAAVSARAMAAVVPVRTGATLTSIKIRKNRRSPSTGYNVGPRIWYRHFVVGGTSRGIRPNPWVARGAAAGASAAKAVMETITKADVRR